jgi:cytochrome P450
MLVTQPSAPDWAEEITVEELDHDPYPAYARMRSEAPVCFVPAVGLWFVTRRADVERAASHPDIYDSRVTPSPLDRTMGGVSILVQDGEPQRRLRAMLEPSLRPRVVEEYAPRLIEPIVSEHLNRIAAHGEAELMSEYFEPISVLSLGRVLGLGHLDGDTLRRWFHGLAQGATNFEDDPEKWSVSDATGEEIDRMLAPVLERMWSEPDGSTISTMLQHCEGSFTDRVAQILPTLKVILLGTQTRRALRESELGGVTVPAGANLGVLVSSANRDEAVWGPTAAEFDLLRPRRNHAAFGFGPHYCSGHHLSRVQMRIAIQRLFERLPGIRIDHDRPPVFRGWEFRAPVHLHVTWGV